MLSYALIFLWKCFKAQTQHFHFKDPQVHFDKNDSYKFQFGMKWLFPPLLTTNDDIIDKNWHNAVSKTKIKTPLRHWESKTNLGCNAIIPYQSMLFTTSSGTTLPSVVLSGTLCSFQIFSGAAVEPGTNIHWIPLTTSSFGTNG